MTRGGEKYNDICKTNTIHRAETEEGLVLQFDELDNKVRQAKARLGQMLGSDKLFDAFCTICLADEFDDVHSIEETPEGSIYRRYFGR